MGYDDLAYFEIPGETTRSRSDLWLDMVHSEGIIVTTLHGTRGSRTYQVRVGSRAHALCVDLASKKPRLKARKIEKYEVQLPSTRCGMVNMVAVFDAPGFLDADPDWDNLTLDVRVDRGSEASDLATDIGCDPSIVLYHDVPGEDETDES